MTRFRTVMRHLMRAAVTTCCAAALAVTQAAPAHAASRTVRFDFQHLWLTPEFDTGSRGTVTFTVNKCNSPKNLTVLLRRTDGFNYISGREVIKCRAGQKINFTQEPSGTYEFELGKLDDGDYFKGSATYMFPSPR
ncbi:hypothetical protein [Streptomyces sp. NPDC001880]